MRFVVDAQLPPAFAQWLAGEGHAAMTALDTGMRRGEMLRVQLKRIDFENGLIFGRSICTGTTCGTRRSADGESGELSDHELMEPDDRDHWRERPVFHSCEVRCGRRVHGHSGSGGSQGGVSTSC